MDTGMTRFTTDQQRAYELVMSGKNTFITGGAGTGKSYLVKRIIHDLEADGKKVVVCAPTWAAALNVGGVTIHRAFGFGGGACITERSNKIKVRAPRLICNADVIIIDEISMCRIDMMDAISASIIKAENKSGHSIQLIVVGDFCQIAPVINETSGERYLLERHYNQSIDYGFAFQAPGWDKMRFENVILHEVVRQNEADFINCLNAIRLDDKDAIKFINENADFTEDEKAISFYPRNQDVDKINERKLNELSGNEVVFEPLCSGEVPSDVDISNVVRLKKGAFVVITSSDGATRINSSAVRNEPDRYVLHNGSTGTIIEAFSSSEAPEKDYIVCQLTNGAVYMISRVTQDIYDYRVDSAGNVQKELAGTVYYMPVKLGYAQTIHRSQSQTYDSINLLPACWVHGQLYVGLSRTHSIKGLHLARKIRPGDLIVASAVLKFYQDLEENIANGSEQPFDRNANNVCRAPGKDNKIIQFPGIAEKVESDIIETGSICLTQPDDGKLTGVGVKVDIDSIQASGDAPVALEPKRCRGRPRKEKHPESVVSDGESAGVCRHENELRNIPTDNPEIVQTAKVNRSTGRPARYPHGTKICRIPLELLNEIEEAIGLVFTRDGVDSTCLERLKMVLNDTCQQLRREQMQ